MQKTSSYLGLGLALVLAAGVVARADEGGQANVGKDHLGLKGFDPVSYFTAKPTAGRADLTAVHAGIVYRFATEENRSKFLAAPDQFAPAYGGWCATALAKDGSKVDIDPTSFKVTGGRLYLFYKGFWGNAIEDWVKDESGNIVKADAAWRSILAK
jgi:YHS domain-containing protein